MSHAFRRAVQQIVAPLQRRINNMIARGVITALSDAEGLQNLQATLTADEVFDGMERVQQYGFTSVPPLGSEIVALFVGGNRDHPLVLGIDNREFRLRNLNEGDAALYSMLGNVITTQADGTILIKGILGNIIKLTPTGEILFTVGDFTLTLGVDGVFRNEIGKIRFEADQIELHALTSVKIDAGGTGFHAIPGTYNVFGAPTVLPPAPPEIP